MVREGLACAPGREKKQGSKYLRIAEWLRHGIATGKYRHGARLPSEAELVRRFRVSRMTVVKAVQYLQHEGLVVRRPGSGTYVANNSDTLTFGLLIPELGQAEIFEPICQGMVRSHQSRKHVLLWERLSAASGDKEDKTLQLCRRYIEQQVNGVFFAPIEFGEERERINREIFKALEKAAIPVVLLDRCGLSFPLQCNYDLIAMDNLRAGYLAAAHLVQRGARSIAFLARAGSAETVEERIAGCREALQSDATTLAHVVRVHEDASDYERIDRLVRDEGVDAIVCANDEVAAYLMQILLSLEFQVPGDVRIVGFDDVRYARLLPVPLTTVHQPCAEIGAASIAAMIERVNNPSLPPRTILLRGHIVVRRSCGWQANQPAHSHPLSRALNGRKSKNL